MSGLKAVLVRSDSNATGRVNHHRTPEAGMYLPGERADVRIVTASWSSHSRTRALELQPSRSPDVHSCPAASAASAACRDLVVKIQ